ncbi:hypothetical protein [Bradyrhizobium sp. Tv2a-2]|nr:hypothetical protein [Bradyrhizobium sp. Tv2a-2]
MAEVKHEFGVRSGTPFRTAQSEQVKSSNPGGGQVAKPNGGSK